MIKVNEYFDGNVKSLSFENTVGVQSAGIMLPGEYEFGTSTYELMKVISGKLIVKLPESNKWETFKTGETFEIEKNNKFQLKVEEPTAYLCLYK
ncbi:MAG: pyrimidine/purine nucleoside phosphorylase [Bacteroidales bacterium]|nr:pyrimidine/purine nucleoside phosphorylase [Bacteroidales bacterium]MBN2757249.1 pyrimidine/purine nucleoside phosphorylase [Bacteroidales bacterium]